MKYLIIIFIQIAFTVFLWWIAGFNFDQRNAMVLFGVIMSFCVNLLIFFVVLLGIVSVGSEQEEEEKRKLQELKEQETGKKIVL